MGKKTGRFIGRVFIYIILFICIGLMASPFLKNFILETEGSKYRFHNFSPEELDQNIQAAEDIVMERDIAIPDMMGIIKNIWNTSRSDVIGGIIIESAGLYLPVFNGTTKANLMVGAGTMQTGQVMGEGNYSLAGHHMKDEKLLFGPLLKVEEGDWVQLTDKKQIYTYEVNNIEIIHQSNVEVMADTAEPIITLITCDKTGVNTDNRLMVRGRLVDVSEIQDGQDNNKYLAGFYNLENESQGNRDYFIWIWVLCVGLAAFFIQFIAYRMLRV